MQEYNRILGEMTAAEDRDKAKRSYLTLVSIMSRVLEDNAYLDRLEHHEREKIEDLISYQEIQLITLYGISIDQNNYRELTNEIAIAIARSAADKQCGKTVRGVRAELDKYLRQYAKNQKKTA